MRFIPCSKCKQPVHSTRSEAICSRDNCKTSTKILTVKQFDAKVKLLTRGY